MEKTDKIQIAKNFVNLHKDNDINNWQPLEQFNLDKKYYDIYNNILGGVYGECRENDFNEYEIEIGSHESKTGNPIVFEFEIG